MSNRIEIKFYSNSDEKKTSLWDRITKKIWVLLAILIGFAALLIGLLVI